MKDDIKCGKSYYLAEAESLLRVIKAADNYIPVFTLSDEIFRGTNPVERIASSAEILSYINNRNAIKLLEYLGYPKMIVEKSYVRCREIENYM